MQQSIRLFALLGALSVALGAFGAHGLQAMVSPEQTEIFNTGVRYQFYHAFAIGFTGLLLASERFHPGKLRAANWCFGLGILLFSGSLYALSLREVHGLAVGFLGPITPIGGLLMIIGWVLLFLSPRKIPKL